MYWNGDKRKNYEGDNASWIVTLDVLKFYWDAGRKNAYLLNSNIRCIEMKGISLHLLIMQ